MSTTSAAAGPGDVPKTKKRHSFNEGTGRLAAILLSPTMLVLAMTVLFPILAALYNSVYREKDGVNPQTGILEKGTEMVGAKNYSDILSGEMNVQGITFWDAFSTTSLFTIICVSIETVLGVAMALIMHKAMRGRGIVRASILVPWAIPTVVSALLWKFIFDTNGLANEMFGVEVLWSQGGWKSFWAVVIADTWKTAPFIGLLTLAGLQTISAEVYEAAKVDGASAWRTFTKITLPLVKPALVVAVLFRMLDTLRMFDLPFVMIGNRKENITTLSMLAYDETQSLRFGSAAALATLLFLYIALAAVAFVKLLGADVIGEARQQTAGRKNKRKGRQAKAQGAAA